MTDDLRSRAEQWLDDRKNDRWCHTPHDLMRDLLAEIARLEHNSAWKDRAEKAEAALVVLEALIETLLAKEKAFIEWLEQTRP